MRRYLALVPLLLVAAAARAQTVVPVETEPYHRTALLTPAARVLDIRLMRGDSTLYHRHARPYFWVVVTGEGFDTQAPAGAQTPVSFTPGHVGFTAASDATALVHRVFNRTGGEVRLVSAEIDPTIAARCAGRPAPAVPAGARVVTDTLGVSVYRVQLAPGRALPSAGGGAQLWISLTGGTLGLTGAGAGAESVTVVEPGQFVWEDRSGAYRNAGPTPVDAVVLRWRACPTP